ncbi:four helix bundle protein [Candidatus Sumerlaeota bacterium]|nr:four helix bundle protein [Candidatus Sumerlaeota bacterium]
MAFLKIQNLDVYQRLCRLHLEVCQLSHNWPAEEKYELGSQVRRSSNSAPAQLAEKNDDRHIRNKIEGVNRSRGEAAETIHHLYMAHLKGYLDESTFSQFSERYQECIRMLNGLEKNLERHLPDKDQRWNVRETASEYNQSIVYTEDERDIDPRFLTSEH